MRGRAVALTIGALAVFSEPALASEFALRTSRVAIPQGEIVTLSKDDALQVDSLSVDGEIVIEGHALRIETTDLTIGVSGAIRGYSKENVLNPPSTRPSFAIPAAAGRDAPAQGSNNKWYIRYGSAGTGSTGADGQPGDTGSPGEQNPGSLLLITETFKLNGSISLVGQTGAAGQAGQSGQNGGIGGRGMDAECEEGNTSTSCKSGSGTSGPGGLAGFGGQGGPGGRGGAAVPVVVITYSSATPDLRRASSLPGEGGARGTPGSKGVQGEPGGAGRSCSATAHWGSFFGACSINGGVATTTVLADNRSKPTYITDDKGDSGPKANWSTNDSATVLLSKGARPERGILASQIDLSREISASRRFALRVELAGRLATTLLRIKDDYVAATPEHKLLIENQFQSNLLPVIKRAAEIVDLSEIVSLIEGPGEDEFGIRIDATVPILRESFVSERKSLLNTCDGIKSTIKHALGERGTGYFQRVLSWCSAAQLTWLPFIAGDKKVIFNTPQPVVGPKFTQYFSLEESMQAKQVTRMGRAFFVGDTGNRRAGSQMITSDLVADLQSRVAPSGQLTFSIARSQLLLNDILALERGVTLIRAVAQ